MRIHPKINDWRPEVGDLLATLEKHGCTLVQGNNGGDDADSDFMFDPNKRVEFIENLIACDEAALYVRVPGVAPLRWTSLVLGNSPGELVADHHVNETIDRATDEHFAKWEGRPQPTRPDPTRKPFEARSVVSAPDGSIVAVFEAADGEKWELTSFTELWRPGVKLFPYSPRKGEVYWHGLGVKSSRKL